jgi:cbb3-type cytochrome oxidase subunit 3
MPEGIRALLTLILPLPLLLVFYWLIVKAARKAERDRSRPSH